jgi:hypothetical protein
MQLIGIEVERANSLFPTMNPKLSVNCYAARTKILKKELGLKASKIAF